MFDEFLEAFRGFAEDVYAYGDLAEDWRESLVRVYDELSEDVREDPEALRVIAREECLRIGEKLGLSTMSDIPYW